MYTLDCNSNELTKISIDFEQFGFDTRNNQCKTIKDGKIVGFVADHVELVLPCFLGSLLNFLSVRNMLLRQFLIIWAPPGRSFLLFIFVEYAIARKLLLNLMLIKY